MAHHAAAPVNHGEAFRRLPETSSRCVMEGAAHNFEISNYELLEGIGVGNFITSSTFSAGGYDWNIKFYPDGDRIGAAGHASAFLVKLSEGKDVRAKFSLTMLDNQGNAQQVNKGHVADQVFSDKDKPGLGFSKFVEKSKMMMSSSPSNLDDRGYLTLRCDIVVVKEPPAECETNNRVVVPPPKLIGHLDHALKDGRGADVTLLVGGREFRAHRFMLAARSPVFDAQLFGPMKMDQDTQHIEVDDMDPAIFEMLLQFIYTDSLPPSSNSNDKEDYDDVATMQHLLVAADRYGLDRLKAMCENKLCNSIDVQTVKSTLALASQHYSEGLKNACLEFISKPAVAAIVFLTDGIKQLTARPTPLALEENPGNKAVLNA